ncbi:hypothetical protein PseudUWO311_19235 [Pseudanabaena sp. UWO311]|uniref:hypothetical protein n=1 Tax=Pseudanabaena sp. UWO311 TaxID=2487337 RepID=UPI001157D59B|nr:hypothetical protein [Pseudanabaena sp. UWO311]TYQ24438.1 hypothetical protein PseudUWO311_19235 [Pseudanabaena sp. UWO311]
MKLNLTLLNLIVIGAISFPCWMHNKTFAAPINLVVKSDEKIIDKVSRASECNEFITITNKAAGASNTTELSVILRYINDLKQDLMTLKVEDIQLKSLQERYLKFSEELGDKLTRAKRDQDQGDYAAFQAASANLISTGNKGIDLEQELQQYCRKLKPQ